MLCVLHTLYSFQAIEFNVSDIQDLFWPILISFGIDLLHHAYCKDLYPFSSCLLPFVQVIG